MDNKSNTTNNKISISHDEAMSSHVDDILNRQKNLTGERGLTPENKRAWYFQNWFLFGFAGALAAFIVWALLEPSYDDNFYIQGIIEEINLSETMPERITSGNEYLDLSIPGNGWVTIRGQKIWLAMNIKEYHNNSLSATNLLEVKKGREVGLYIEYTPMTGNDGFAIATLIDTDPPLNPPEKASYSLKKLDRRRQILSLILFPLIAGAIGLAIGAVEGIICRNYGRAIIAGLIGLTTGLIGGFVATIPSSIIYHLTSLFAMKQAAEAGAFSGVSFFFQMTGRSVAWGVTGIAMGLGQGIAFRSGRLLLYGMVGGIMGGLLGGLFFDPIDMIFINPDNPSAHLSRMIGFVIIGLSVGVMIGVVQLLARDAWLRMTHGPLSGKEFLFFKDKMIIGSSPQCEIFLFNDSSVHERHAILRVVGDNVEIENLVKAKPVVLNSHTVTTRSRLNHGDQITIGKTVFLFETKQK